MEERIIRLVDCTIFLVPKRVPVSDSLSQCSAKHFHDLNCSPFPADPRHRGDVCLHLTFTISSPPFIVTFWFALNPGKRLLQGSLRTDTSVPHQDPPCSPAPTHLFTSVLHGFSLKNVGTGLICCSKRNSPAIWESYRQHDTLGQCWWGRGRELRKPECL